MNIHCDLTGSPFQLSKDEITKVTRFILEFKTVQCDEVSLHFVDKVKIAKLHEKYFNDESVTDCISFPMDNPASTKEMYSILGEIFICPSVAIDYCREHKLDPSKELTLYIVHGLLHLLGYDDIDEKDRQLMRLEEDRVMMAIEKNHLLLKIGLPSTSIS